MNLSFLEDAVREGMDRIAGGRSNEDLEIYNRLQPSDFKKLKDKFGDQFDVISYIKQMESARIQNANTDGNQAGDAGQSLGAG